MRKALLAVLLFAIGMTLFAQQTGVWDGRPTSEQTRDTANRFLAETRSNSSDFESLQADLQARNKSNNDNIRFFELKREIQELERSITTEQRNASISLNRGMPVEQNTLDRIQRLIDQHKSKLGELESLTR